MKSEVKVPVPKLEAKAKQAEDVKAYLTYAVKMKSFLVYARVFDVVEVDKDFEPPFKPENKKIDMDKLKIKLLKKPVAVRKKAYTKAKAANKCWTEYEEYEEEWSH